MPSQLSEQAQQILPLFGILLAGILVGMALERFRSTMRRRVWRERKRKRWARERSGGDDILSGLRPTPKPVSTPPKIIDPADQLRIVMTAQFTIQPLLNRSEVRVFKELDRMVISCNPGWQVMAQVSLGEILRSTDADAYSCINAKRVDLLLVDENCHPRHALEYQGHAHHQSSAAARDAVKKEALRRAGIGYHEIIGGHTTPSELRRLVEKLVHRPVPPESERTAHGDL
ncbi:DUF2726 domain-containing protein [Mesorhizobium sp. M3A.F.Ca.ET.174.01.1.1]|uniref:DUF2726 domain-containing protein n=1 Tax=unclassified Mesorhizobium TaxID=325217 RepID=UPI001093C97A|nr:MULTISPECIES: DUF2726 domain-containing protein [unclassified Mesorhizobium]TGS82737.1 DUF2726 domain-containing protein [Mesorhizobium sp. M3A.F.Ca.ET.175.01.1.1]TGT22692.1 DUF2726 domain-containing protein [Mesorhizobium sp. M3A.F.Ca.ET.174.01.1.1]